MFKDPGITLAQFHVAVRRRLHCIVKLIVANWSSQVAQWWRICLPRRRHGFHPDQEYSLEEGMTSHSSILARETPWIEEPGGIQSMGLQRFGHSGKLFILFFFSNLFLWFVSLFRKYNDKHITELICPSLAHCVISWMGGMYSVLICRVEDLHILWF